MQTRSPFLSLKTLGKLRKGRLPGQVVIQFTTRCNAACAQCGMRRTSDVGRHTLDVDLVKRELDAMAAKGVESVSFTGGEPLLYLDQVADCMTHAGRAGIRYIRTGTNGFIFSGHDKPGFRDKIATIARTLAGTPMNAFWISLDSADPGLHETNRGLPGIVEGIRKGLPIFHEHGIYPAANLGINRLTGGPGVVPSGSSEFDQPSFTAAFKGAFRSFYAMAEDLGFATVNACYPMSFDEDEADEGAVYAATSTDDFIRFTASEKAAMLLALYEVIPEFRHRLRIFTPRAALRALMRQHVGLDGGRFPCRGGIDFFFADAENMNIFPCGYRGTENLGRFSELDLDALDADQVCELCDWECFRDPSVLAWPILRTLQNPLAVLSLFPEGSGIGKAWQEDLRYYRACDWFNCRIAPNKRAMARFGRGAEGEQGGGFEGRVEQSA